jgi:hypothetical protein
MVLKAWNIEVITQKSPLCEFSSVQSSTVEANHVKLNQNIRVFDVIINRVYVLIQTFLWLLPIQQKHTFYQMIICLE